MRIVLVADTFPPRRTSGAVQLRDLARGFVRAGHSLTVLLPDARLDTPWRREDFDGADVLYLKAPETKDVGYVRRTLAELAMPFAMGANLKKSPLAKARFDGVVWYSPSIFHGPLVRALKRRSRAPGYLILRDIFPQWAADMGLMGRGLPYRFFNRVARYQYGSANVIGVQTPGNRHYFTNWEKKPGHRLEVLENWLDAPAATPSSIDIGKTALAGRKILVFAGNMGVAQGLDTILALAERLRGRPDIGFLFVGRGSEAQRLRQEVQNRKLDNTLFFDEIDPDEIPALYAQCSAGIVALDHRHRSHNIPGKFLTYMQSGLPALANINPGNDLAALIRQKNVGEVVESNDVRELQEKTEKLLDRLTPAMKTRCQALFTRRYAVESAVRQIVAALESCR